MDFIREKVVRLGPKFLDPIEMNFLGNDPLLYTIAWSAKETIYKCQGKKGISLKENILLQPFVKDQKIIKGIIYGTDFADHHYSVEVEVDREMVLTYTVW